MDALNEENFAQAISSGRPIAVDFWAEWCMPCKMFAPVLEELSDELDGKADFYKVNVDDNMALAQKYNVSSIPNVVIFKNGKVVDRMVGVHAKEEVVAMMEKHI